MMPPHASPDGTTTDGRTPAAASLRLSVLRKRSDFLRVSRGRRVVTPGFILQAHPAPSQISDQLRIGFTCSKKVGNAVARNRAKRRLREIARLILPQHGVHGTDYVLVGRKDTTGTLPFTQLQADLKRAVTKLAKRE